jgi:hypothetical protein
MFASVLSACQRPKFYSKGHLTTFKVQTRSIANVGSEENYKKFMKLQDPKQIIIYCKLNSKKQEACYNVHLKKSITKFKKSHKSLSKDQFDILNQQLAFEKQDDVLQKLTEKVLISEEDFINNLVRQRKNFCQKNAKKNIERCLKQYLNNDTFTVLNKYQSKNKLNGLEHNYFIKKINTLLTKSYDKAKLEIENSRT